MAEPSVISDLIALGGAGLVVTEFGEAQPPAAACPGVVRVGVHRHGKRPSRDLDAYDILFSADLDARAPWVGLGPRLDAALAGLKAEIARHPAAAACAAQVLRASLDLSFGQALVQESTAYSMLLG